MAANDVGISLPVALIVLLGLVSLVQDSAPTEDFGRV